ncbi:nucleoside deaminase [Psychroserpens sp. SPM9]|uniref:nucleoside deaminase n=1 Tax=Psychroserpens sp. SPM9 TaxID=2975598 RepID=UPI0021A6557C|nr:nucleoside deaminase [Psychroserpens sp. SPM9]MDG5490590.1 nucleoside deaminase [Psychroserpens sp. SPM9]
MNRIIYVCACFLLLNLGCDSSKALSDKIIKPVLKVKKVSDIQQEVDDIHSLLIYSLVYADWQPDSIPRRERRGYNIGALLVDKENIPVHYGLNCINSTDNATQHGEVRAITSYLEETRIFNLKDYSIYTTLEPCVMCAGMMTMTAVKRVVYGQRDVAYSKAFERLAIDTTPIGGFEPYPRQVISQASNISFCAELDEKYHEFLSEDEEKILAKFLASEEARLIYLKAEEVFLNYSVKFKENENIYIKAIEFYKSKIK